MCGDYFYIWTRHSNISLTGCFIAWAAFDWRAFLVILFQANSKEHTFIFITDGYVWACQLTDPGRSNICCYNAKANNFTRLKIWFSKYLIIMLPINWVNFDKNFRVGPKQGRKQTKLVHLRKLEKTVTIQKLITTAQTQVTPEFEFIH